MSLHSLLIARQRDNTPIRIGVIGAGKFGSMFLSQAIQLPGMHVVAIADLNPDQARSNLANVHWQPEQYCAGSLDDALASRNTHVCNDYRKLVECSDIDLIVEATGNPVAAVPHILAAFAGGKHVVSATVEADSFLGSMLSEKASEHGVVYSLAYGDQPAMACELVDWARTCGFGVAAAGRGHKWKPEYRFSTPDTVWDHWGVSREVAERGRLNPKMFNSFLDGTKPAIESAAIANACGLLVPSKGLQYPRGDLDAIPSLMRPRNVGGALEETPMVEVVNCLREDGSEYDANIRMGVFVVVEAVTDYQRKCLEEYKVTTDDTGCFMCLYKRWHLIGLELGMSVASVAIRGEPTGTPTTFNGDVVAVTKRDLKAGETLDGEGGYTVAGQLRPASISLAGQMLPLGLTSGVKVLRDVATDAVLTYDDVELNEDLAAVKMRRELEEKYP